MWHYTFTNEQCVSTVIDIVCHYLFSSPTTVVVALQTRKVEAFTSSTIFAIMPPLRIVLYGYGWWYMEINVNTGSVPNIASKMFGRRNIMATMGNFMLWILVSERHLIARLLVGSRSPWEDYRALISLHMAPWDTGITHKPRQLIDPTIPLISLRNKYLRRRLQDQAFTNWYIYIFRVSDILNVQLYIFYNVYELWILGPVLKEPRTKTACMIYELIMFLHV